LATLLDKAKKIWINDSYWLVMPFKLKDSGVTLKYLGEETEQNQTFQVLQLTFEKVGVTPENKYKVYVNSTTHLVSKWAFFRKNTDEKPEFENVWSDYLPQGKILLSGNRGRTEGSLSEIKVDTKLPKTFFSKF
jgi:plasmid maintenance system killer protein